MKGLKLKTISLLIFYVWLVKSEKLVNAGTVDQLEKYGLFFLISSMVLGLLHHLQMFWQFHLIKLLKFVTGLGLLQLQYLIYPRLLTDFAILFSLTNVRLMIFLVRFLALFVLPSVMQCFEWFWIGNVHKNIKLMPEFLKALL